MIMYERQENVQTADEVKKIDEAIQLKFINALSQS
jgi:hypothetical protein